MSDSRRAPASVSIVMPAYNEADGLGEFLAELCEFGATQNLRIFVVDDCSTDATRGVAEASARTGPISVLTRPVNGGHGLATLTALHAGLTSSSDLIVAVDGDGQAYVDDVRRLVDVALITGADVVEGCRRGREEPTFRKAVSLLTRILVGLRSGSFPRDANTPNRVYRREALARLLTLVPEESLIPNLWIALAVRRRSLSVVEVPIRARRRRGRSAVGTMWRASHQRVPSRRYLLFCLLAGREWFRPLRHGHHERPQ